MALPGPDFHSMQDDFLKLHDFKTGRLWFLWPGDGVKVSTSVMGKCGCLGGCVFFGNNRNGIGFFHPKKFRDVTPTAVCKVSPEGMDPGFGQSLLHKNKLIFDIGDSGWLSPTREFAFTRGYMSSVTTPDTPVTGITVVEEINASPKHVATEPATETIAEINLQAKLSHSPTGVSETPSSSSVVTTSPSEVLSRESIATNPFDTVRSVDSATLRDSARGSLVETQGSSVGNLSLSSSQSPPPFSPTPRSSIVRTPSSRSSGQSPSGRSSVTSQSPGLNRRMRNASTRRDPQRQISTVSLESELYYSAEEDAEDDHAYSSSDIAVPPEKMADASQEIHSSGSDSVNLGTLKRDPGLKLDLDPCPFSSKEKSDLERQESSSSLTNSTLSYMSADTDPDDTLSQGMLEEELSMVDLHGQVSIFLLNIFSLLFSFEPVHEKTNNLGSEQVRHKLGCTDTRWLEAGNFGFRNCTIHAAKTKVLISFPVTAKLICAFVFTYADYWFSHVVSYFESRDLYYIKIVIRVLDYEFEWLIFISSDLNSI